jgi:penicillin-binding protein 1C
MLAWGLIPKPALLDGVSFSQAVYDRQHHLLRLTLANDQTYRLYVPLKDMAPALVEATLLQEDQYFYYHLGVNPIAVLRAAWQTYGDGERRIGASTLTMQVARVRFRIDSRSLRGKLEQIARAIQLERHYSKDEILQAYLNLVSYGGNIDGVAAASLIYYNKNANQLNLAESLALTVIPQSPARRTPRGASEAQDLTVLNQARRRLFEKWVAGHPQDRQQQIALTLPMTTQLRSALAFRAPHFVNMVVADHPAEKRLDTTLDSQLQGILERQVQQYVEAKKRSGIHNAAAMLIDYRTMDVRAMLGSADFFSDAIQGQVNGTRALRSPGSALKPFIYALGMDQGVIHPLTMLKDAPASYGGYNPENFDRQFAGPIKAHDALIKSRNLPAVQIAAQLTQPDLYDFLKQAGVWLPRSRSYYGLALTLGGAEVTMQDLIRLYAMLGNGGVLKPLRTLSTDPHSTGTRLLSEEASFLVRDILKDNPRPAQGFRNDWTRDALPVYWKTGTSHGYRDAWAIGLFGPYVLAVWIGNFDNEENTAFVGVEAAAPLLFQIIDAIKFNDRRLLEPDRARPANIAKVEVCALSGDIPGPHCKNKLATWFIPGVSPIKTCEVHRQIAIDVRSGRRACSANAAGVRNEIYEFWPSDLLRLFRQAGIPRRLPPQENPQCARLSSNSQGVEPRIVSPQTGIAYSLRAHTVGKQTIPLIAVTDADARSVFWFINEKFLGKSAASQSFYWIAAPGEFTVRAVDDQGRAATRTVKVIVVE